MEKNKVVHKPGTIEIIKEHKYTLLGLSIILITYYYGKGAWHNDLIMLLILISSFILFFAMLLELGRSRFVILQWISYLLWGCLFLSSIFTGWKHWIDMD